MGDLDDGPTQDPQDDATVEQAILDLLPRKHYDLIITHNPSGEYTKHLRHEEISRAVIRLWNADKISTDALWTFAYEDGNKAYYPKPVIQASLYQTLSKPLWSKKYSIITERYGFDKTGWEAETTPKAEAFWQFNNPNAAERWLSQGGILS